MVCLFEMRDFVKLGKWKKASDRAGLNRRPLNLQSNALPLSYSRSDWAPHLSTTRRERQDHIHSILLLRMIKYFKRTKIAIHSMFLKFLLWFMRNVWNSPFAIAIMSFLYRYTSLQKVGYSCFFEHSLWNASLIMWTAMWRTTSFISTGKEESPLW